MSTRAKGSRFSYLNEEEKRAARLLSHRKYNAKRPKKAKDPRFTADVDDSQSTCTSGGELSQITDTEVDNLEPNHVVLYDIKRGTRDDVSRNLLPDHSL